VISKVLNNKMGDLRIDSDLTVTGELRAPRSEGELAVSTGRINLDPLLANTGGGGYSTKPTEFATSATPAPAVPTEGQTPGFAGIQLDSTPHGAGRSRRQERQTADSLVADRPGRDERHTRR